VRYIVITLGILAVIGGLAAVKFTQISSLMAAGKAMQAAGPPPEVVATAKADEQIWDNEIAAVGSISAGRGVAISNEVPGEVRAIHFESGATVKAGQVLVELDSSVERAQLRSAVARRELARTQSERTRKLVAEKASTQAELDSDSASLESSSADVAALEAQIQRKVVRAPFAGKLGIRQINLGQYLDPGSVITDLQSTEAVHVDFSLPQQELARVAVGMPVRVDLGAGAGMVDGKIGAIEPALDSITRSIRLRAELADSKAKVSPGMFVNVHVVLPEKSHVVIVPATSIVHASYGDSLFVVEDAKPGAGGKPGGKAARQQFVKVGLGRGDFVAILDGVKPAQEIVSAGAFKLRNGASVIINNSVGVKPELAPHPENR
jgi:membrane fusion protein (multidrug efflux system)